MKRALDKLTPDITEDSSSFQANNNALKVVPSWSDCYYALKDHCYQMCYNSCNVSPKYKIDVTFINGYNENVTIPVNMGKWLQVQRLEKKKGIPPPYCLTASLCIPVLFLTVCRNIGSDSTSTNAEGVGGHGTAGLGGD